MKRLFLFSLFIIMFLSFNSLFSNKKSLALLKTQFDRLNSLLSAQDLSLVYDEDYLSSDFLKKGKSVIITTTLYRGNIYAFLAVGDQNVKDIDIILYDENDIKIADDGTVAEVAYLLFENKKKTGEYKIEFKLTSASKDSEIFYILSYAE